MFELDDGVTLPALGIAVVFELLMWFIMSWWKTQGMSISVFDRIAVIILIPIISWFVVWFMANRG